MPPDRHSSRDAFYIDMLDPGVLDTPDGLNTTLRAIEAVCYRGSDFKIVEMVAALDSRPYLLEYIVSSMLRVSAPTPRLLLALIILPSSAWGRGLRETLGVDTYRISQIYNAKRDRHHEYASPPEIIILIAIHGISIRCRYIA